MSTKAQWRNNNLHFYESTTQEMSLPVAPVAFYDDFLKPALDTGYWTALDTAGATEGVVTDGPGGAAELALTNANEAQLAGLSFGDHRPFVLNRGLVMEARVRFTVVPTGAVIVTVGLAGDHNAAADSVAESIWFRADGNGTLTVENDDTANETSKVATGVTLAQNTWAVLRIECTNPASVEFYINGNRVAGSTTFNMNTTPTLVLQPYITIRKGAATTVGTMEVDYVRVWQNRA